MIDKVFVRVYDISEMSDEQYDLFLSLAQKDRRLFIGNLPDNNQKKLRVLSDAVIKKYVSSITSKDVDTVKIVRGDFSPYVSGFTKEFSIGHSGEKLIFAVSDGKVGADIEKIRPINIKYARYFCNQNELEYIQREKEKANQSLFKIWTKKEAVLKYNGLGIDVDMRKIDVINDKRITTVYENGYVYSFISGEMEI